MGLNLSPGFPNRLHSGERPDPPQQETIQEIELVRAARQVIFDSLQPIPRSDLTKVSDWDPVNPNQIELAKWVIENIWTPELEPID